MKVEKNRVVAIEYLLSDENGDIIDSNVGYDPVEYLHGAENIIPGLESGLVGHERNDMVELFLHPEHAYGNYKEELKYFIPLQEYQGLVDTEVGSCIHLQDGNEAIIVGKKHDSLIVDANHPLAGKSLRYTIKILDIRDARVEEIEAGHALPECPINDCEIQGCYC